MKKISPVQNYISFSIIQMKKKDYCPSLQFKKNLNNGEIKKVYQKPTPSP